MAARMIANTQEPARHPWPEGCHVQGGARGLVFRDGEPYRTAFVEAFPAGTFLRGEGKTITEAEDACWAQYEHLSACPHDEGFDRRDYVNGSGFCRRCGTWFGRRVTGFDPLPEHYQPSRRLTLLDRVFSGDGTAITKVLDSLARVDELPDGSDDDA